MHHLSLRAVPPPRFGENRLSPKSIYPGVCDGVISLSCVLAVSGCCTSPLCGCKAREHPPTAVAGSSNNFFWYQGTIVYIRLRGTPCMISMYERQLQEILVHVTTFARFKAFLTPSEVHPRLQGINYRNYCEFVWNHTCSCKRATSKCFTRRIDHDLIIDHLDPHLLLSELVHDLSVWRSTCSTSATRSHAGNMNYML